MSYLHQTYSCCSADPILSILLCFVLAAWTSHYYATCQMYKTGKKYNSSVSLETSQLIRNHRFWRLLAGKLSFHPVSTWMLSPKIRRGSRGLIFKLWYITPIWKLYTKQSLPPNLTRNNMNPLASKMGKVTLALYNTPSSMVLERITR